MSLLSLLLACFASSFVLLVGLQLAFRAQLSAGWRIREEPQRKLVGLRFWRVVALNAGFSAALVFGTTLGLSHVLFTEALPSLGRFVYEFLAVLFLYDLLYYLAHRYLFHEWKPLASVHAVHHTAKFPTAIDSLYIHPVETLIGLTLLFVSLWLVGPVSVVSFGLIFLVYSHLNILLHCGLRLPGVLARPLNTMHQKHDRHHVSMKRGNYASITPLPDLLFGTAE
jgi:sterol desaturase/sphingolipid hydroxylase (fatty acid hydroxylase superfamily)